MRIAAILAAGAVGIAYLAGPGVSTSQAQVGFNYGSGFGRTGFSVNVGTPGYYGGYGVSPFGYGAAPGYGPGYGYGGGGYGVAIPSIPPYPSYQLAPGYNAPSFNSVPGFAPSYGVVGSGVQCVNGSCRRW